MYCKTGKVGANGDFFFLPKKSICFEKSRQEKHTSGRA